MRLVKQAIFPLFILLLSLLVVLPLFHSGYFPMHDDTQPTRVFEMAKSLSDGMFPVRWVKDLGFGYGYPIFNFYGPLPYYIGALFQLSGLHTLIATKIMMAFPALIGGVGMYLFVSSFLGVEAGIVSSVIYLFFPYFAVNMYVRGAVGEYYAYGFLPYVFWGLLRLYYDLQYKTLLASRNWIFLTAGAMAFLIVSHNLSAFMLFFVLSIILLLSFIRYPQKKRLLGGYTSVFLVAFLLSCFYAVPAFLEMGFTNVRSQVGGGADFHNHYVCLSQFWASPWGFGGSAPGCLDGMSFELGKSTIIFSFLSIIVVFFVWILKKKIDRLFIFLSLFVLTIVSLFMATSYSQTIWNSIPDIAFLQYPWRFLEFTGVGLSVLVGFLIFVLRTNISKKGSIILAVFIIGATLFYNLKLFKPQFYEHRTSTYYTAPQQVRFTISKISHEYMPKNFTLPKSVQSIPTQRLSPVSHIDSITVLVDKTEAFSARVTSPGGGIARLNIAWFPAWQIYIDGKHIPYRVIHSGILITIPRGDHLVEAHFRQTLLELLSDLASLAGIIFVITGIIYPSWIKHTK